MFNRILIPLDGSLLAERAIPHAERFARIFGSDIILLRILGGMSDQENQGPIDPLSWVICKAEAEIYMQGIASGILEHLHVSERNDGAETTNDHRVEYVIREGRTAESIIDFAHSENIDLLVISSHGSGGLSRWGMSSIIQKVIDLIYLPLLIIRSYNLPEENNGRIHYRNILLPIDSSRRAECVLPAAVMLAKGETVMGHTTSEGDVTLHETGIPALDDEPLAPRLLLASVIGPPEIPIPTPYPVEIQKLSEQLLQVSRKIVLDYLGKMKMRLPVESDTLVVESKNISSAIQDLANQENVDLVVMSAHGYSGQYNHPYGNVTRNMVEHGAKSILVIQDVSRSQVQLTAAAVAAEKFDRL